MLYEIDCNFEHYSSQEINETNFLPINEKNKIDLDSNDSEIEGIYMKKTNSTDNNNYKTSNVEILTVKIINDKKKKRGRKKKNEILNYITKRNKYAKDNIFRKIKPYFFNKFLIPTAIKKIKCSFKKQKYLVRKINQKFINDTSIEFNIKLFNAKIRNFLNQDISNKYSSVDLDKNKMILKELEKYPEFNEFLNYSINDFYKLFINDNYKEIISNTFNIDIEEIDFKNITGKIEELREKGEDEQYLTKFKYYAYNIHKLMDESKKRRQRKKKIDINSCDN